MKIISILGYFVLLAGILALLIRHELFATGPISVALQILAGLLMLWARITFGARSFHLSANPTAGELVTTGPFRYFRHPIYAAIFYFVWIGVFVHLSVIAVVFGLVATAGIGMRIYAEEQMLRLTYPEYDEYAAKTKRLVPGVF